MDKSRLKNYLLLLLAAAGVILCLMNFNIIWKILERVVAVLTPFTVGLIIAYVVNMPYSWLYHRAFAAMGDAPGVRRKVKKALSLILAFALFISIIAIIIGIVVPELSKSFAVLQSNIDTYIQEVDTIIEKGLSLVGYQYSDRSDLLKPLNDFAKFIGSNNFTELLSKMGKSIFPHIYDITMNISTGIYNGIISIVVSVYLLASKERLLCQTKKILCAFLKEKRLKYIIRIARTSNEMISKFICAKVVDSAIIGVLCFILLSIFNIDFAGLIAAIVGIANIIPFFGPIVGGVAGTILLLLVHPIQALWFILIVLALQQIDGNIIGPKILGDSVGMDGFWIMFGVLIGGGLFGFMGMILGVPVLAVIYLFFGEHVNNKLSNKNCVVNTHTIDYDGEEIRTSPEEKESIFAALFRKNRKKSKNKKELTKN